MGSAGGSTTRRQRRWWDLADLYEEFCRTRRRIPSHRSPDPVERGLTAWVTNSRVRRGHLDQHQRLRLAGVEKVHATTVADRADDHWRMAAHALIEFCATHDHPPRVDAADDDERQLARWAESYRHRVRSRKVADSVVQRRQPLWEQVEAAWQRARDARFGRLDGRR